jgi:hypothetical protein
VGRDAPRRRGPCQSGAPSPFLVDGACGPPATFPPTSFCCIGSTCNQLVASDVAELSEWLATQCNFNGTYPATVGHRTEVSPGSRVCTPGT